MASRFKIVNMLKIVAVTDHPLPAQTLVQGFLCLARALRHSIFANNITVGVSKILCLGNVQTLWSPLSQWMFSLYPPWCHQPCTKAVPRGTKTPRQQRQSVGEHWQPTRSSCSVTLAVQQAVRPQPGQPLQQVVYLVLKSEFWSSNSTWKG